MLPFVMPGLITGVAFLAAFNAGWLVLSGTAAIIILAYFVRKLKPGQAGDLKSFHRLCKKIGLRLRGRGRPRKQK